MNLKRRIPQYIIGLLVFSLGVVTISQADVGISPVSTIPFALSKLTSLSFGTWTWIFHFFCVACQIVMLKKLTLKTLLQFPLAFVFGKFIDQYKWCFEHIFPQHINTWFLQYRYLICLAGILISAIGIVTVVGADLMLAPPDAFMRAFAARFNKVLSKVKIGFDTTWVIICIIICVIFFLINTPSAGFIPLLQSIFALTVVQGFTGVIGVGTILSAWLNGTFVGIFGKWFPGLKMEPLKDLDLIPFAKKA